jgi:hypothetical protein
MRSLHFQAQSSAPPNTRLLPPGARVLKELEVVRLTVHALCADRRFARG